MDEAFEQFLIEGRELVQQAADDLLALERDPADRARIDSAFRAVHTLKGSVAVFGFAPMGQALHAAEDLLGAVRQGRLAADRAVIDALLDCVGACEGWIETVAETHRLPPGAEADGRRLALALAAFLGEPAEAAPEPTGQDWLPGLLADHPLVVSQAAAAGRGLTALHYLPRSDCFFLGDDPLGLVRLVPDLLALRISAREPWSTDPFDPFACNLLIEGLSAAPAADVRAVFRFVADQVSVADLRAGREAIEPAAPEAGRDAVARTLRVDATRVDALADIVGELIVAKNSLAHLASRAAALDPGLARDLGANQSDIDRLVGDLYRAVMGVRMTPLTQIFRRFPRLVRDLAGKLGKDVRLEIRGGETEADKSIVDGLFEPLLHVLRNAADHGIEDAEARAAAGKPPDGRITLEARQSGERLVITVSDDGAGIALDRIRAVAKARGLIGAAALEALDDDGVMALIFAPGFSTSAVVSDVSGRGVGMDAVRAAVEGLGGRVSVGSVEGEGSTVTLTLPQTVSVTTVMTVRVGDERFGVPIEAVIETARVAPAGILPIRSGAAFVLRDRTIPLLRLADLLDLPAAPRSSAGAKVLIVAAGDQRIGVEVDGFAERVDVLLRPLPGLLSGMPGMLGASLLGDGRVLMVLNLPELIG